VSLPVGVVRTYCLFAPFASHSQYISLHVVDHSTRALLPRPPCFQGMSPGPPNGLTIPCPGVPVHLQENRAATLGKAEFNLAWHNLRPWPDAVPGLYRLKHRFIDTEATQTPQGAAQWK